jgi:hypothetical protein
LTCVNARRRARAGATAARNQRAESLMRRKFSSPAPEWNRPLEHPLPMGERNRTMKTQHIERVATVIVRCRSA